MVSHACGKFDLTCRRAFLCSCHEDMAHPCGGGGIVHYINAYPANHVRSCIPSHACLIRHANLAMLVHAYRPHANPATSYANPHTNHPALASSKTTVVMCPLVFTYLCYLDWYCQRFFGEVSCLCRPIHI
eukprot:TRINITY_DN12978_c1_g1_i1.p1 TRINITY_DN12978_c1_g1~~TRINITY_DN12978_c1_g1_i1.p1  ORF type:complete len:130 (+),score=5.95 TRINITY_DN12978_c1_g1_i1:119-508(+)